jgi:predicted PurR-regulated permease PerM
VRLGEWIGLFALFISLYILWQIRQIVLLIFAAVILATILNRVVKFLQRYRIKRGIAIAIAVISLIVIVVGFFAIVVPRIVEQLQQLVDLLPQIVTRLQSWNAWLRNAIPGQILDNTDGLQALTQQLQTYVGTLLGNFIGLIRNSLSIFLNFLLFLVLTVMILVNPRQYRRVFILAFPSFYRRRIDEILQECEESIVGWIRGTLFNMLVIAVLSYIALLILGVRLPLINALLAGLLEFIPNLGPTLSILPPALLSLLDTPWKAVGVIIAYLVIQQFESLILVPFVMQREVSLMPAFTLIAVVVFASFFGFLGLFLAIPLLIVTQIWLKEVLVKDVLNQWNRNETNDVG